MVPEWPDSSRTITSGCQLDAQACRGCWEWTGRHEFLLPRVHHQRQAFKAACTDVKGAHDGNLVDSGAPAILIFHISATRRPPLLPPHLRVSLPPESAGNRTIRLSPYPCPPIQKSAGIRTIRLSPYPGIRREQNYSSVPLSRNPQGSELFVCPPIQFVCPPIQENHPLRRAVPPRSAGVPPQRRRHRPRAAP